MNESTHNIETADPGNPAALADTAAPGDTAADAIADGVRHRLDPRSIPLQRVVGRIVTACVSLPLAAGIGIAWTAGEPPPGVVAALVSVWAVITGVLGWWLHRWAALHHRYASYTVNAEDIEIRSGVVWRKAISVPRSRVQHTDVSQGPLERRYGLGTLGIYTAGTDYAKVSLDGLEHETALRIRDHLLPPAGADAV